MQSHLNDLDTIYVKRMHLYPNFLRISTSIHIEIPTGCLKGSHVCLRYV